MTSTPTPTAKGTQAPNQIELLWFRYRSLVNVVLIAILAALGINYAMTSMAQAEADKKWADFAVNIGLDQTYKSASNATSSLTERLAAIDAGALKQALSTADNAQKPFFLMALARKAILAKDWAEAEANLATLEKDYPNHSLVRATDFPVQTRDEIRKDPPPAKPGVPAKPEEPEFKPAVAGSAVAAVRAQIVSAKAFVEPSQFAKPTIPADATKVKFELGTYGSFTIALMPQARLHREAFLKLAQGEKPFWKDLAIDEIRRPTKLSTKLPREFHLGYESTKEADSSKWSTKEPSKNLVDFETNSLSHFAGAVSARNEADGKSCADRFWVSVDDTPRYDGERVIFGWVVDGLDNLKRVCEATLSAQEEEQGRGKPTERIQVTAVSVLQ